LYENPAIEKDENPPVREAIEKINEVVGVDSGSIWVFGNRHDFLAYVVVVFSSSSCNCSSSDPKLHKFELEKGHERRPYK